MSQAQAPSQPPLQGQTVAVFCASRPGHDPAYLQLARGCGAALAGAGAALVYGGARVGAMGAVADAALAAGGTVVGVLPERLRDRELAHTGLHALHITRTMHERKAKMAELATAFVALPGGLGTLDELFEIWTWRQLGLHNKPIVLVDHNAFWQPLLAQLDRAVRDGLLTAEARAYAVVVASLPEMLAALTLPR